MTSRLPWTIVGSEVGIVTPRFYEQLLVAASRHPRKLADVDEVIRRLTDENGEPIVPEAFLRFWEAFRAHIPKPAVSKE